MNPTTKNSIDMIVQFVIGGLVLYLASVNELAFAVWTFVINEISLIQAFDIWERGEFQLNGRWFRRSENPSAFDAVFFVSRLMFILFTNMPFMWVLLGIERN